MNVSKQAKNDIRTNTQQEIMDLRNFEKEKHFQRRFSYKIRKFSY